MEGYSWMDVRSPSHTYIQPQSGAVFKCVCICIHNTETLEKTVTMLSAFVLIPYFLSILSLVISTPESCFNKAGLSVSVLSSPSSFQLVSYKVFWPQRIAAGFSILSSLCNSSPSYCLSPTYCTLPPGQSQLSSTLRNTPACYTNTQMQAHTHTHKPSHVR